MGAMNRYDVISLIVLAAFIVMLPLYAVNEPARMQTAQDNLRLQTLDEAAVSYGKLCSTCHGLAGQGIGVIPPLNNPGFKDANAEDLFNTIARAGHGTGMAAWHLSEGGVLNDYQINQLVTLIQHADWKAVKKTALELGLGEEVVTAEEMGEAFMALENSDDPHACAACHEEPAVHLGEFGLSCARCHSSVAWTPAVLTKHIFALDHGGEGQLECDTCHVENYAANSCYTCHDHTPDDMKIAHEKEKIAEYENCIACHPTGQPDEAKNVMNGTLTDLSLNPGRTISLP